MCCLSFTFSRSRLIIVSELSFPNFDRIVANSSIKVDVTMSVLFNFGGLYILPIVMFFSDLSHDSHKFLMLCS